MIPNLGANEARETVFDPQKGFYLHSLLFKTPRLGSPAFSQFGIDERIGKLPVNFSVGPSAFSLHLLNHGFQQAALQMQRGLIRQ
jgi:hypothetical protein